MVAARSRIKQADSVAHSSGRSGGDSLVFEYPGAGVLQKIPTATGCIPLPDAVMQSNDGLASGFRHFTIPQAGLTETTRGRDNADLKKLDLRNAYRRAANRVCCLYYRHVADDF